MNQMRLKCLPKVVHVSLAFSLLIAGAANAAATTALFTEDFNREAMLIGRDRQADSFLPLKHAHVLPGWTKLGDDMPAHWVEQYPGNWVLMLVANRAGQNVFTQKEAVAANDKEHVYTVSFDAGPGVYAGLRRKPRRRIRLRLNCCGPTERCSKST